MTSVRLCHTFRTLAVQSGVPDVRSQLASIGFRRSSDSGPLSDAIMHVESSSFVDSVLNSQHSDLEISSFVLTSDKSGNISRWSAFYLHSSNQFFIKPPMRVPLCKQSLLSLLDLAEQLQAAEVFVCLPCASPTCDALVAEFVSMDFHMLTTRSQLNPEYVVLRFDF